MNTKPPPTSDLAASDKWITWKFGIKGQARGALRHVNKCLDEIASREYDLLMTKADLLGYLEKWDALKSLLSYLDDRYPNDPEVLYHHADFLSAHGKWKEALSFLRKAERKMGKKHT